MKFISEYIEHVAWCCCSDYAASRQPCHGIDQAYLSQTSKAGAESRSLRHQNDGKIRELMNPFRLRISVIFSID